MKKAPYFIRSGLNKRSLVSVIITYTGGVLMFIGFYSAFRGKENAFLYFMIPGLLIALTGFLVNIISVKCRKCGAKLYWKAVTTAKLGQQYVWLMSLKKCPSCGYNGKTAKK